MKKNMKKLLFLITAAVLLVAFLPAQAMAAVPAAPTGLIAVTVDGGRVDLYWTDNSIDETGFIVERAPDIGGLGPGTYSPIGPNPTVPADTNTYTDITVMAATAYWYRVSAVNADGLSFYSNQVRVFTPRSTPVINLVTPTPPTAMLQSGADNIIQALTEPHGAPITSAEYQLILDNAPGVFEAHDIYGTQKDLTIPAVLSGAPIADSTPVPPGIPAGAIMEMEIRGTVAAVDYGTGEWQIGTTPLYVYESATTSFIGSRIPIIGDAVKIMAYREVAGGPLVAMTITYIAPIQPLAEPAVIISFLYNGMVTALDAPVTDTGYLLSGEVWTIGTTGFRIDAPDFPAYLDPLVVIGSNVTVRFTEPAAPANVARQIFRQITKAIGITTEVNPVFDTTPIPLGGPPGTWLYVIVDGVVTDYDNIRGIWTVGDEQVKVYQTANTIVEPATVGDEVLCYGRRTMTPGPIVAEQINLILPGRLISPVKGSAVETYLMYNGNIEAMGPNTWMVGGQTFIVDDPEGKARIDTMPLTSFNIGDPVTVQFEHVGETLPDDANWASLALTDTSNWDGTLTLPVVPENRTGTLFLRVTDSIFSGSTIAVPASLLVPSANVPLAPSNLMATNIGSTQVDLAWLDNSADENGFRVERADDVGGSPGMWATLTTTGPNITTFSDTTTVPGATYHYRVFAFNLAGDSPASNVLMVTTTPPSPTKIVFITPARTMNAGSPSPIITIQTQDDTNNPLNVLSDTIINLASDSPTGRFDTSAGGLFDGSITSVTITAGTNSASFYYRDTTSGTPTITASDTGLTSGQQMQIVVAAGEPVGLVFSTGPQTFPALTASGPITVVTQNSSGTTVNVLADTTVNIVSSSPTGRFDTSAGGAFSDTSLSLIIPSGGNTATFYYMDSTAGNPGITASSVGLNSATQTETITPASATQLIFLTQPSGGTAGFPFVMQPIVAIADAGGNIVTTAIGNVTVAITGGTGSPGANLSGTLTMPAVNGVATFTDLSIDVTGNGYTLTAMSAGLTDAISSPFNIVSGPQSVDIQLWSGWNLISMPLIPLDTSRAAVFSGIEPIIIAIWAYDAASTTWTSWSPDIGGDLTTIVDGKGYWLNTSSAAVLTVTGNTMPEPPSLPPTYAVVTGWNLLGFKELTNIPVSTYLTGNDYRFPIYGYANGAYIVITTGATNMIPGLGYWVYFNAGGEVTP